MNPIARLIGYISQHCPGDKYYAIAYILLDNIRTIVHMTIYEIADLCFSSTTTIIRFVRKLGFAGFSDFKFKLSHILDDYQNSNRKMPQNADVDNIALAYLQYIQKAAATLEQALDLELLTSACTILHNHKNIVFFCDRTKVDLAPVFEISGFQIDLVLDGKRTYYFDNQTDLIQCLEGLEHDFVLLEVCQPKNIARVIEETLSSAQNLGGKTIVLSYGLNSISSLGDIILNYTPTYTYFDCYIVNIYINLLALQYRHQYLDTNLAYHTF